MRQDFFQSYPVSKALSFLVAGVTYLYEGVTATSIVVLSFILLFLHLLFYKFRNTSVRKCLIVQLAKFFMLFIIISTNSLNEMRLSLRPIISTATRQ